MAGSILCLPQSCNLLLYRLMAFPSHKKENDFSLKVEGFFLFHTFILLKIRPHVQFIHDENMTFVDHFLFFSPKCLLPFLVFLQTKRNCLLILELLSPVLIIYSGACLGTWHSTLPWAPWGWKPVNCIPQQGLALVAAAGSGRCLKPQTVEGLAGGQVSACSDSVLDRASSPLPNEWW